MGPPRHRTRSHARKLLEILQIEKNQPTNKPTRNTSTKALIELCTAEDRLYLGFVQIPERIENLVEVIGAFLDIFNVFVPQPV